MNKIYTKALKKLWQGKIYIKKYIDANLYATNITKTNYTSKLPNHIIYLTDSIINVSATSWSFIYSRRHYLSNLSAKAAVDSAPFCVQPYLKLMRIDKPIGTWLLFWPCAWSIAMAGEVGHLPDVKLLVLFGLGSLLMRSSGCIINDMWDKDFDKQVERTRFRPLASNEITMFKAFSLLGCTLSASLIVLLQLNWCSIVLGAASLGLVAAYPYMKRVTFWPQIFLGLTLNYGVLLGWTATTGSINILTDVPLYASAALWTLIYDTIYAHQDKYDDLMVGVKSTALLFGDSTKGWLTLFCGTMISCLAITGWTSHQLWPYWVAVAASSLHIIHQIWSVDLDNASHCGEIFRSNVTVGAILFIGIVLSKLLQKPKTKEKVKSHT